MDVLLIQGSPRKNGNTAAMLNLVADELANSAHTPVPVELSEFTFADCCGCMVCRKTSDFPGCIVNDGMAGLREKLLACDAVLIGSPLYMWGFPAHLKAFLDRHVCLVNGYNSPDHKSLVDGKPYGLLLTLAGPVQHNAEPALIAFERFTKFLKADFLGNFTVPFCSTPDQIGDEQQKIAAEIASRLTPA